MHHRLSPRTFGVALAAAAAMLAGGCATRPDVRHDRDPAVDLRSYKTFAFLEPSVPEPPAYTSLLDARLRQATRVQLEQQHYVYSEADPDLRVAVQAHVVERQELRSTPGARGFHGYRGWSNTIETVDYRQGSLRIDLVDARRKALVWRGVAEGRLDAKAISQPGLSVDATVAEIFAGFGGAKAP